MTQGDIKLAIDMLDVMWTDDNPVKEVIIENVINTLEDCGNTIAKLEKQRDELLSTIKSDSLFVVLENLVDALDNTCWSSWQTTAKFDCELDVAREAIASVKEQGK